MQWILVYGSKMSACQLSGTVLAGGDWPSWVVLLLALADVPKSGAEVERERASKRDQKLDRKRKLKKKACPFSL